jgi:hypothetical protein
MKTVEETVFLPHPAGCFAASCREGLAPLAKNGAGENKGAERGRASLWLRLRHLERRSGRTSALPCLPSRSSKHNTSKQELI